MLRFLLAGVPNSPEIRKADIEAYEQKTGPLAAGDIVLFRSDWSDRHYQSMPKGAACMEEPIQGNREGWPAPGPEAIAYLASKGIRCVGTDAPTLGGVHAQRALWTYWMMGTRDMVGVEFLTQLERVPQGAYFMLAAGKIRGCHGGPGRAIALH